MEIITAYICIGNSDDKLSQKEWSDFIYGMQSAIKNLARHQRGEWFSSPESEYQNACWCIELREVMIQPFYERLYMLAKKHRQKSIAFARVEETEFIGSI